MSTSIVLRKDDFRSGTYWQGILDMLNISERAVEIDVSIELIAINETEEDSY